MMALLFGSDSKYNYCSLKLYQASGVCDNVGLNTCIINVYGVNGHLPIILVSVSGPDVKMLRHPWAG